MGRTTAMPMFPKVLVVDDSSVERRMIGGLLRKELVLTDLRMPEMDGLELVKTIAVDFPLLPVILMTAHGSGSLALQALEQGAGCYVPKTQLADRLLETVRRMLGKADACRNLELLMGFQDRAEFVFTLQNKP